MPIYDRAISSAPLRSLIQKLFTDGVAPNPSDNLQVSVGEGMTVIVNAGFGICGGCLKLEEESRTLGVQASDATYDRIDTVVLRLNTNDDARNCDLYVIQGTPATSPVRPVLTRTSTIWELGLADIFISKGSGAISKARITDTRYDTTRCGVISSISQFDTFSIYDQVQADLAEFKVKEQANFLTWYENIKGQLSEDAAGNLQVQIDEFKESVRGALSATDGTEFRFGVNENGEYGYIVTKDGADTVIPFSNKAMIVSALQYSGLDITEDSTWDEIYSKLAERFPQQLIVYEDGEYTDGTISSFNGTSNVKPTGVTVPSGYYQWIKVSDTDTSIHMYFGEGQGYGSAISDKKIDVTAFKTIRINGSAGGGGATLYGVLYAINSANSLTTDPNSKIFNLNTDESLVGITGEYYIGIFGYGYYGDADITSIILTA